MLASVGFQPRGSPSDSPIDYYACWRPVLRDRQANSGANSGGWPTLQNFLADPRILTYDVKHSVSFGHEQPVIQIDVTNAWGDLYHLHLVYTYCSNSIAFHAEVGSISSRPDDQPLTHSKYALKLRQ
jgi:hypothetical protein